MSELESIRDWSEYNARARQGYLEALAKLPPAELSRDRGASYPSLLKILEHSLDAIGSWINWPALTNVESATLDLGTDASLDGIRHYDEVVRADMDRFLGALTERDLERTFLVPKSPGSPDDRVVSIRDMLWHLVEEELQHRGELNALLWQLDVDPPIFDWLDWVTLPERRKGGTKGEPVRGPS